MKKVGTIMLIDDDPITNFLNELLIKEMDITEELFIALNGKQALDEIYLRCVLSNNCPALILLDVNMPVVNGFAFLEKLNGMDLTNRQSITIVMLSTSLNPRDKNRAEDLHVNGYISKPLTREKMENLLNTHFK